MIVNRNKLFNKTPIVDMLDHKVKLHGVSHGLSEAGYDIRLAQEILFMPADNYIDPRPRVYVDGKVKYGKFTIAHTIEKFSMPTDLVGVVHDKSTWAREGLSVFNTVIEPGWHGWLTLELVYHGEGRLLLPKGAGIAQVLFSEVEVPSNYEGKYQNQGNEPVQAIFELD